MFVESNLLVENILDLRKKDVSLTNKETCLISNARDAPKVRPPDICFGNVNTQKIYGRYIMIT